MRDKRIYDDEGHAHFVTFSCFKRRRYLSHDRAKRIVIAVLRGELRKRQGVCVGFVVMPDHVHSLFWFPEPKVLAGFMNVWKSRSSHYVKTFVRRELRAYQSRFPKGDPVWQRRYYDFNVFSDSMAVRKLTYIHENPVRAGLVDAADQWKFGSARYYATGESVGVPITSWAGLP